MRTIEEKDGKINELTLQIKALTVREYSKVFCLFFYDEIIYLQGNSIEDAYVGSGQANEVAVMSQ